MTIHMQGDIQLVPITKAEFNKIKGEEIKHDGSFVVAYGETSGHKHLIKVAEPPQMVVVKDKDGNVYIQFSDKGTLTHEEHGTHEITPGWYKVGNEKEFNYYEKETRRVQD